MCFHWSLVTNLLSMNLHIPVSKFSSSWRWAFSFWIFSNWFPLSCLPGAACSFSCSIAFSFFFFFFFSFFPFHFLLTVLDCFVCLRCPEVGWQTVFCVELRGAGIGARSKPLSLLASCLAAFLTSCFLWFLGAVLDNGLFPSCGFIFLGGSFSGN